MLDVVATDDALVTLGVVTVLVMFTADGGVGVKCVATIVGVVDPVGVVSAVGTCCSVEILEVGMVA